VAPPDCPDADGIQIGIVIDGAGIAVRDLLEALDELDARTTVLTKIITPPAMPIVNGCIARV